MNGGGDVLARGARSANFGSMSHVPQNKWDAIFGPADTKKVATRQAPTSARKKHEKKNAA